MQMLSCMCVCVVFWCFRIKMQAQTAMKNSNTKFDTCHHWRRWNSAFAHHSIHFGVQERDVRSGIRSIWRRKKNHLPYLAFALANYIMHSLFPWSWLNTWNRTLITVLSALAKNWIVHIKSTYPNNWTEFTLEFFAVVRRSLALRSSSFYWHCLE